LEISDEEQELVKRLSSIIESRIYNAGKEKDAEQIEKDRRKMVKGYFEFFVKREMTDAEYVDYITIFDDDETPSGFNIKTYLKNRGLYTDRQDDEQELQEGS